MKFIFFVLLFFAAAIAVYFHRVITQTFSLKVLAYRNYAATLLKNSLAAIKKSIVFRLQLLAALFSTGFCAFTGLWVIMVPFGAAILFIPKIYVSVERSRYIVAYSAGLQGFLEQVISSLKSGTSITKALQDFCLSDETPVGREFSLVLRKTSLGSSIKDALAELNERVPIKENEILSAALSTAIETGGNLSDVLLIILNTIRQRDAILREVKALTSQGMLSGIIVGALPFLLAGAMFIIDPILMQPLFTTRLGILMCAAAVLMEMTGGFIIFRIVNIKG